MTLVDWLVGGELGPAGHLVWTAPEWAVVLGVYAAVLAWGVAWVGDRRPVPRLVEMLLWGLALAGIAVAVAQPVWLEEEGRQEPGRVAILVDGSRSMGVIDDGKPRSAAAAAIVAELADDDVDLYHFGDDIAVGPPPPEGLAGTDVETALDALRERVAGERLAGVVLITDGLDRGLLRKRFHDDGPAAAPPQLPGPLTIFQVGSESDVRDLAVRGVQSGGFAFLRSSFRITAELEGLGFEGRTVTATLSRDDSPITETQVTLDADGHGEVVFEVRPQEVGRFAYQVSVPKYEGDAVPANNSMPLVVSVVRDRIRVLQVAGHPSWDVKFLRRFLKEDPSVDLVSFFILRTPRDMDGTYRDTELSLIEFPHERLFTTDLADFDLVVFQNFDHGPYFKWESHQLLKNIREFVERDGHALVMVGGDRSFDLGEYAGTPLEDILPMKLGWSGESVDEAPFRPVLTPEGSRHPITRLVAEPSENAVWWERLHEMDGANLTLGPAPGAAVLLEHPTRKTASGDPVPILAVKEAGKGRTMALTVDASWRWSFSEAAQGRGNQAYLRFWKNAFHWLMADPLASRVTAETPRENYAEGDLVRIVVRARDPGFAPLADAGVSAEILVGTKTTRLDGRTDDDGEVVLELPATEQGAHRVVATVSDAAGLVGTARTVYAVTARDPELDEVAPDTAFLQWLAARTDGSYHGPGDRGPILRDATAGRTVWDRRQTAVWRAPILGIWIALFAGLAWLVRRRAGLK